MKITYLQITSPSLDLECRPQKPIVILCGHHSDLALDLVKKLTNSHPQHLAAGIDGGQFVLHADVEMDGKSYTVCYVGNKDFVGDGCIAVNFGHNSLDYSLEDTHEFIRKREERCRDDDNIFDKRRYRTKLLLSEGEQLILALEDFCIRLSRDDDRPIFICGLFDRIDEARDITSYLDTLASLDRQVFVSLSSCHVEGLSHSAIQIVNV